MSKQEESAQEVLVILPAPFSVKGILKEGVKELKRHVRIWARLSFWPFCFLVFAYGMLMIHGPKEISLHENVSFLTLLNVVGTPLLASLSVLCAWSFLGIRGSYFVLRRERYEKSAKESFKMYKKAFFYTFCVLGTGIGFCVSVCFLWVYLPRSFEGCLKVSCVWNMIFAPFLFLGWGLGGLYLLSRFSLYTQAIAVSAASPGQASWLLTKEHVLSIVGGGFLIKGIILCGWCLLIGFAMGIQYFLEWEYEWIFRGFLSLVTASAHVVQMVCIVIYGAKIFKKLEPLHRLVMLKEKESIR